VSINKNFVIKHGIEVTADALVVDSVTKNVGIGTTIGRLTLDVRGSIGSTSLSVSGIGTIRTINNTFLTSTSGNITNLTGTSGTIGSIQISSGIVTASSGIVTYYGDGQYLSNLSSDLQSVLNKGNSATIGMSISGVSTFSGVEVGSGIITSTTGIVTYYGDGQYLTNLPGNPTLQSVLNAGNSATIGMSISGVSTFGTVKISSGIVTATSGIVTYYGDGSNLTGVSAGSTVADDTTTNQTFYPIFTQTTSGTITASKVSTTKLSFNPSTGVLTVVDLNSTSDIKLKENIHTVQNALDVVDNLRGVSFDWKESGRSSYGVIAQELEEVLPELVGDGETKSVNYNGIIGVLIEAIKELKKEIEDLKSAK
jgi:hypothetical protein